MPPALGTAEAARDYCVEFARTRTPGGLSEPIGKLPVVREQVGRIEIDLAAARALLFETAEEWDETETSLLGPKVAATKIAKVPFCNPHSNVMAMCWRPPRPLSFDRKAASAIITKFNSAFDALFG